MLLSYDIALFKEALKNAEEVTYKYYEPAMHYFTCAYENTPLTKAFFKQYTNATEMFCDLENSPYPFQYLLNEILIVNNFKVAIERLQSSHSFKKGSDFF